MSTDCAEDESKVRTAAQFATTHWSVVLAAGDSAAPDSKDALEKLCRQYWHPVYAFARRLGHSNQDAEDLTQGFFAHVLERHLIHKADAERGRFRSYLLGCFKRYLANENSRAAAGKRGGRALHLNLIEQSAEDRVLVELQTQQSPDVLYDRAWAATVLEQSLSRMEHAFKDSGREPSFRAVRPFFQGEPTKVCYTETARRLGTTEGTIKVTVHRMRRRFRELLRATIAETVSDPLQVDEELEYFALILHG